MTSQDFANHCRVFMFVMSAACSFFCVILSSVPFGLAAIAFAILASVKE